MLIRQATEADYLPVIRVLNEWWGGRQMTDMLPRLFFQHFQSTSYIAWEQDELVGFLIGFCSQTRANEGYIHFIGVHPGYRKAGVARQLYERFFQAMHEHGRDTVRCITSPINETSIRFHTSMGFAMEAVHTDYDGVGQDRILFIKKLSDASEERL